MNEDYYYFTCSYFLLSFENNEGNKNEKCFIHIAFPYLYCYVYTSDYF